MRGRTGRWASAIFGTRLGCVLGVATLTAGHSLRDLPSRREFVRVRDGHFVIGAAPYHFLGVNLWYGMNLGAAGGEAKARLVRELDHLQRLGVTNVRLMAASEGPSTEPQRVVPAVQNAPGRYDESLLQGLDFLLAELAKRDMHGVLVLNNFFQWTGGMAQYVSWATGEPIPYPERDGHSWDQFQRYAARFYTLDAAQSRFEDYIRALTARRNTITGVVYRDDPTIMAWQLSNEPRGFADSAAYVDWIDRAGAVLRRNAPNQLISLGGEGKLDRGTPGTGTQFERVSRSPFLDYLTIHLWIENWGWYDPTNAATTWDRSIGRTMSYLADHVAIANAVQKPLVLEEFGVARDGRSYDPAAPVTARDRYFATVLEALYYLASGGSTTVAGGNVWSWSGEGRPVTPGARWRPGDSFTGDPPHERQGWYSIYDSDSSTLAVIGAAARRMDAIDRPPPRLRLSRLIADGMVMQRGIGIPVWGWGAPGDDVVVSFHGTRLSTRINDAGSWHVVLPALPAGGPYAMHVAGSAEAIDVRDILVGDVWVCSGQSNMEFAVVDAAHGAEAVAAAHDSSIRQFKVPKSWAAAPDSMLSGGAWTPADPAHVGQFTAIGYYFARALRRTVHVPIGLINTTWGGSRIEPWMSAASLGLDSAGVERVMAHEAAYQRQVLDTLRERIGGLPTTDSGVPWAEPGLDDSQWTTIAVPSLWPQAGYAGFDGAAWYRTTVDLSDAEARAGAKLGLGPIDASDVSWVNGYEVGRTTLAWNTPRVYTVPPAVLHPGRNVIAVRVENVGGGGGIFGDPGLLYIESPAGKRPLAGQWRFKIGVVRVNPDTHKNQVPTVLYNKMIHPLLPYPIAGVLWYQGESNADAADAFVYRDQFARMITDWRRAWQVGDFPFLFVQLASFMAADSQPAASDWAVLRESQGAALSLPKTAQAVTIDVGDAHDIHPKNKEAVGERLALAARRVAYGERLVASGPVFHRQHVAGSRVVVEFSDVGRGLTANAPLQGFAIAGADRHFVWANATIDGDHVVVWSDQVAHPVAVRYAWGNNPAAANLFNLDGLPATPFRTDQW